MNSVASNIFFGHIGMVVKLDNTPYIFECTEDYYYCDYSKKIKNGIIFHKAYDRIKNYSGRVYLSRNNLYEYIKNVDIFQFMKKYGHFSYLEHYFSCTSTISNFLYNLNIIKDKFIYLPNSFIYSNLYKIDYKTIENIKIKNDFIIMNTNSQNT